MAAASPNSMRTDCHAGLDHKGDITRRGLSALSARNLRVKGKVGVTEEIDERSRLRQTVA